MDELPNQMLLGHQQQILDAFRGVCGAVWTHDSEWDLRVGLTRQELYEVRDQSGLSPAVFYQQQIGKATPEGDRLEVPGKVDVY
jgi:hypothetical protein